METTVIKDVNGIALKTGDVIEISGRPVKNDNGRFLVITAPGDCTTCNVSSLTLHKIGKSGRLLTSGYTTNFYPEFCEQGNAVKIAGESAAAREYFTKEAAKAREMASDNLRRYGAKNEYYQKTAARAAFYENIAASCCSAATWKAYIAKQTAKAAADTGIRFYWNGIKVDGKPLIPCYISMNKKSGVVSITAREYSGTLPAKYFDVENNSDAMTDYFEKDHVKVMPEHPLYRFARYAALKHAAHNAGKGSAAEAALSAAKNPGQPTAADLEAVEKMKEAAEAARIAAQEAADAAERERVMKERNAGKTYIMGEAEKHPINDSDPVVIINWSEHPAFYDFAEGECRLSITAAEIVLKHLDEKQHNTRETEAGRGWYYKTDFTILYNDPETGEESRYNGRGGLITHIRRWGEYLCKNTTPNPLQDPDSGRVIIRLADYLETFTAKPTVSVAFAPGLEDAINRHKSIKAADRAQAKKDWEYLIAFCDTLTDDQIEYIVSGIPHDDKTSVDVVRFFVQQLGRRDRNKAIDLFRRWNGGAL